MNGNQGIVPTVDLATNNSYPYPVMSGFGSGFGGFGGDGAIWIILIIALLGGFNNGNGGFGNGFDNGYAWLSNGQKDIMNNTNNGFDTLHLSNQLEGTRDAISGLSTQICGSTADVVSAINNGFANVEISANSRQMADMQQNFNNQIATLTGFNNMGQRLDDCCCENRLGIANLTSTILAENCADRQALNEGVRDIIASQTAGTQRILDQLCQDKIDAKNEKIVDLQREILMKDLQASQIAQTSDIRQGFVQANTDLYNLSSTNNTSIW